MRNQRYDNGGDVRRILIGMATSPTVCSRISSRWPPEGLFDSPWANLVGGWCVQYEKKFGGAPGAKLTHRFERWAAQHEADDATVTAVERFLQVLSDQSQHEAADGDAYLIDLAAQHFNQVRLRVAHKQATVDIDGGRYEDALRNLANIRRVQLESGSLLQPAEDFEAWDRAMQEERRRPLVTYPEVAGKFVGDSFVRGEFYSFEGPDKTGKSTLLVDFVYRACRNRHKVAFFDAGDGNEDEFLMRLGCRVTESAEFSKLTAWPEGFDSDGVLKTRERQLTQVNPVDSFRRFRKMCGRPDALRVECHPNSTLSVAGIDSILSEWERDDWRPDVVVVDYADILAPPEGVPDQLQQIDQTWRGLRRMSQSRNCLVMTATQSNSAAYGNDKKLLSRKHFSGRKTKLAEVNGMIGINVSEDERKLQMARWNWIVRRKDRRHGAVVVAGCFDTGNPVIQSRW